jgi:hypothetical protein
MTSCLNCVSFKKNSSSSLTKNICGELTKEVIGIVHYTSYKNLLSIIKDGKIISKIEALQNKKPVEQVSSVANANITESEFPGIFTSLLLKYNIGYEWDTQSDMVFLIFSKVLLKQKNYHIRSIDNMGLLDANAYSREYIDKALEEIHSIIQSPGFYEDNMSDNELIFHNPISLNALESIVVTKRSTFNKLKENLPEPYNNMVVLSKYVEDKVYNKYCNLSVKELNQRGIINTTLKPNFCVFIHHDWIRVGNNNIPEYIDPTIYSKFADNCGVNIDDLTKEYNASNKDNEARASYYKKINRRLKPAVLKHFHTNDRLKPKWLPGKNLIE